MPLVLIIDSGARGEVLQYTIENLLIMLSYLKRDIMMGEEIATDATKDDI